jgi:hypothetical protein
MKRSSLTWSVWAVMLAVLVVTTVLTLAACGSSDGSDASTPAASPEPTNAPAASSTSAASSTPAAVKEFRGMLPIVFTQSLVKERDYRSSTTVGDVEQMRHAAWTYRNESSDPRLSGRFDVVINLDQRQSDMSSRMWGTSRLTNSGGTWLGKWTGGIAAGGDVHHLYITQKGTGVYAGLVSHSSGWFVEAGEGFTPDIQIVNAGWIETNDGSPVPPAPGPGASPANWTPVVGIATTKGTNYDGTGAWRWDLEQSDPRISGRLEGDVEEIGSARPDGSIDFLSSNTITNQDGSWDAPSGPVQVRGPGPRLEHFMYWTETGSGAYAGLTYHGFWYFPEPENIQPGDEFVYTGWIDEAR